MRGRRILSGLLVLTFLVFLAPSGSAQAATCGNPDDTDGADDVGTDSEAVPDDVNGFNRLDIRSFCFAETAEAVVAVVTMGAEVDSGIGQSYTWTFHYKADNGADQTIVFAHAGGTATSEPADRAEADGNTVRFSVPKSAHPPGTPLGGFFVEASGTFVDTSGTVLDGSDRAPDEGISQFQYTVGKRAPAGTDTDGDGVEDADEVAAGTDPTSEDSDGDGLTDQEEADLGTNPLREDSDSDGLTDEEERTGNAMIGGSTVSFGATDPTNADTDGDSLNDRDEIAGTRNGAYAQGGFLEAVPGSTDPNEADTDGDGLSDGDEVQGQTTIDGSTVTFPPTDPNDSDTDNDNLNDLEEVQGFRVTPSGQRIDFSATDPTDDDSDGDGIDDFREIQSNNDPTDPNDKPTSGPVSDTMQYLPISAALLLVVVLVSMGGILWRWG